MLSFWLVLIHKLIHAPAKEATSQIQNRQSFNPRTSKRCDTSLLEEKTASQGHQYNTYSPTNDFDREIKLSPKLENQFVVFIFLKMNHPSTVHFSSPQSTLRKSSTQTSTCQKITSMYV